MTKEKTSEMLEELLGGFSKCPYDYPLDIENLKVDKFGYFEAILGRNGNVYEAPNGHQRGVVMMIARDKGISPNQVEKEADRIWYIESLLKESGAVLLWHNFYMGNPNEQQMKTIEKLKSLGHMSKKALGKKMEYEYNA